ncbi:nucleic acid-binding protein [Pholiota conissans]|uniref:Nucleic acid-binding protein n=1 Tax=Pholiota conissans TaxID=109636 RepID=A0A9P6D177_9AGAR|nr:nucleic acid-binding protein [Pholiota conissans]
MPPMAFNGVVTKAGFMNKTATVTVSRWIIHKLTGKRIERSRKFLVHDENNQLRQDDLVTIRNCRPISAMKKFKLERILKSPETEREIARAHRHEAMAQSTSQPTGRSVLEALRKQSNPPPS